MSERPPAPTGDLGAWLAKLRPGSDAFASTSRAAIFLLALQQRARETFYADLCEALLGGVAGVRSALDIGCGAGNLAFELAERLCAPVTGLDTDRHLLPWANRAASGEPFAFPVRLDAATFGAGEMPRREIPAPVRFVAGDLFRPPFAAGTFDLVCLANVLDSVADPEAALARAVELLRPSGLLLFASPDSWNLRTTPGAQWRTTTAAWDALFASAGLETTRTVDDLEWRLKDTPRLHHIYRVHGRLLRKR